jgi:hypothetical protein
MEIEKRNVIHSRRSEIQGIIPRLILIIRPSHIYVLNLEALDMFHDNPGCTVINKTLASRSVVYQATWISCPSSESQIHVDESQIAQQATFRA